MPHSFADWNPVTYDKFAMPHRDWAQQIIRSLDIKPTDTIMDAGCGTGYMTSMVAERVPHGRVIAVDLSQPMLDFGNQIGRLSSSRIEVIHADLTSLRLASPVDGIFSNAVFHWILDQQRLFSNLFRCLKPSGWLVSQAGGGSNLRGLLRNVFDLMVTTPYASFFSGWVEPWIFLTQNQMERILSNAGFSSVKVWLEDRPVVFETLEDYCRYLREIVLRPYLAKLPAELQQSFLLELGQRSLSSDRPLGIDYQRLNVHARKP